MSIQSRAIAIIAVFSLASVAANGRQAVKARATQRNVLSVIRQIRGGFRLASGELRIRDVKFPARPAKRFRKFEVTFQVDATYTNPFDPDDIDVEGRFVFPDGREVAVPAFYSIAYEPAAGVTQLQGGIPFKPTGEQCWRLRFAPPVAGAFRFYVTAKDAKGRTARSEAYSFTSVAAGGPGFVRVSKSNPMYFEDSADGSLFFGAGANVAWTRTGDPGKPAACYEYYFDRAKGLMSSTRVWMCHWAWLEWTPQVTEPGTSWMGYAGVGYYNQMVAAEFDRVFELAERHGLRVMLVTDDNNEHYETGGAEEWFGNPYNTINGGPCARPSEVFSSPEARRLYRNRLRYIIAHWGYSTSLWAINSWNDESDAGPQVRGWLKEMHDYVHDLVRCYRPIIYGSNFAANDVMDYAQAGPGNLDPAKPNVVQECEFTENREWFVATLRQAIWRGLSRGMASMMVWPHTLVDELNAWTVFVPPLKFLARIPLNRGPWERVTARVVSARSAAGARLARIVTVAPAGDVPEWGARATESRFRIALDENNQAVKGLGSTLYGRARATWRNPPTFLVNMPEEGQLVVEVEEIGGGDQTLEVKIDGCIARHVDFLGGRRELRDGERRVRVPLPKGSHSISIDNARPGGDWIRVRRYYVVVECDDAAQLVDVCGLRSGKRALLYIENQTYTRLPQELGQPATPLADLAVEVSGLPNGRYRVAFFDTETGDDAGTTGVVCTGGVLTIPVNRLGSGSALELEGCPL